MGARIAIIGSGITGLSAAWLLSRHNQVQLFEKASRPGGHTNTLIAPTPDGPVAVDTGFIVYNERNYTNLTALFDHLGVETAPSCMSFAVSVDGGRMEYSGARLNGLFGQRRNIVRAGHWQLVADILRFFRHAETQVKTCTADTTLAEFLDRFGYSKTFIDDHILPLSAAIWSTPALGMLAFPARTFVDFCANHGLLQIAGRPQWRTARNGAGSYIEKLRRDADFGLHCNTDIVQVVRHAAGVELVFRDGARQSFDEVVLACHADQALELLADPSPEERALLSAFRFTPNRAVLHTDKSFMPRRRHLWSSWNYLRTSHDAGDRLSVTYWMNRLQPLPTRTDLFVTLNPGNDFSTGSVVADMSYDHPLFDSAAIAAQREMWRIQGGRRTWFAGAWLGYGFHEDGLQSGLEVAERIGPAHRPWTVERPRARIAANWDGAEAMRQAAE